MENEDTIGNIDAAAQIPPDFFDALKSSKSNGQGYVFYPNTEEQKVMWLITSDGSIGFWGIKVGDWVINDGVALKIDPRGTDKMISLENIFETYKISPKWHMWDNKTIEFLLGVLPE